MMMSILKLMDIPNFRKVFFIDMLINLKLPNSLENSNVRFIYFHNLQQQQIQSNSIIKYLMMDHLQTSKKYLTNLHLVELIIRLIHLYNILFVQIIQPDKQMELALCYTIFIIVAIILLILFCLLLKYHAFRMSKRSNQANDLIQIGSENIIICQGAYKCFKQRQNQKNLSLNTMKQKEQDQLIEESIDLRAQFNISNDIYGLSSFRKRLNIQTTFTDQKTLRQLHQMKVGDILRLQGNCPALKMEEFSYIKKIIQYSQNGLLMIQVSQQNIQKQGDRYILNKKVNEDVITKQNEYFESFLQLNGFEDKLYCCYKYTSKINVRYMKEHQKRAIKQYEINLDKQMISTQQFYKIKLALYQC